MVSVVIPSVGPAGAVVEGRLPPDVPPTSPGPNPEPIPPEMPYPSPPTPEAPVPPEQPPMTDPWA